MRVLYLSNSMFPWGQAYATRIREIGHAVAHAGGDFFALVDYSDRPGRGEFDHGGYEALMGPPTAWSRFRATAMGARAAKRVMDEFQPDALIIGNLYDRYGRLVKLARARGIPVILEICEWFSPANWKFAPVHPYARAYERAMLGGYDSADGAITISRALEARFATKMPTIRIPTILDVGGLPCNTGPRVDDVVRVAQVGFPGRAKELIAPVLEALRLLDGDDRARMRFEVFGPTPQQLRDNLGGSASLLDELGEVVTVHGRIPQQEVADLYTRFHYTVFIRPDTRANRAGFPTKLAESLAAGTPVIANQTGDVDLYLNDGGNGLLTAPVAEGVAKTLHRALKLSVDDHQTLRRAARTTAEESFDYAGFAGPLEQLIRKAGR